jgi:hypothetical protein
VQLILFIARNFFLNLADENEKILYLKDGLQNFKKATQGGLIGFGNAVEKQGRLKNI